MAATLIQIKSRMLLPPEEEVSSEEQQDPRLELVNRLLEYQAFKEAASNLRKREEEWMNVFHKEPASADTELCLFDLNLFDLLGAFKKILDTASPELISITKEILTVKDKMSVIMEMLAGQEAIRFEEIFKEGVTRRPENVTIPSALRRRQATIYAGRPISAPAVAKPQHSGSWRTPTRRVRVPKAPTGS
jgi:segregation and condensation protein A